MRRVRRAYLKSFSDSGNTQWKHRDTGALAAPYKPGGADRLLSLCGIFHDLCFDFHSGNILVYYVVYRDIIPRSGLNPDQPRHIAADMGVSGKPRRPVNKTIPFSNGALHASTDLAEELSGKFTGAHDAQDDTKRNKYHERAHCFV